MKLIYCCIKHFRNIENQEINLSPLWYVHLSDGHLSIRPRQNDTLLKYVCGDQRSHDLHVVVGKTGSGKTNFLQLLGLDDHLRYESAKDGDSYVLVYSMSRPGAFAAEIVNMEVEGLTNVVSANEACLGFEYKCDMQKPFNVSILRPEDTENTYIVNSFDRYSFACCPFDDNRIESISYRGGYLPRMVTQFGNSRVSLECESIKSYLELFDEGNIKYRTSLCIRACNWQDTIPVFVPERIHEKEYWTYSERRLNGVETEEGTSKSRFIHDLKIDFALYLRKWAATVDRDFPTKYYPWAGFTYNLGIRNPRILPDGKEMPLDKRIDWLCQYIDYHTDEITSNKGLVWQIGTDIIDICNALEDLDDKYFTDDAFVIPVSEIDMRDDSPMSILFERMDQYRPDQVGIFTRCLLPYTWTHLSSGEYQFAKVWSILNEYAVKVKIMPQGTKYEDSVSPNLIVLLDEPESYMHPEMCRRFISQLYRLMDKRPEDSTLQVILTTHSPFMLSDVLSSQVIKMDIGENGLCQITQDSIPTFAANVHSIMADSFFLDYTIGEYSRVFLTGKFSILKGLVQRKNELTEKDLIEINAIKELVPHIGDDIIRQCFESLLKSMSYGESAIQ